MKTQTHLLYAVLLLFSSIISLAIAIYTFKHGKHNAVAKSISFFMASSAWWAFSYAIHWLKFLPPYNLIGLYSSYLGVVTLPIAYLSFVLYFTGKAAFLTTRVKLLLTVEPVVTLVLLFTDKFHGLFFGTGKNLSADSILEGGIAFWGNIAYSYIIILIAFILLVRFTNKSSQKQKKQLYLIIIGSLVPWLSSFISLAKISPVPDIDLTPFAFTISGIAFAYSVFKLNLLKIIPIAREKLIEVMTDGVLVVDSSNNIIDINPAACKLLGLTRNSMGKNAVLLFQGSRKIVNQLKKVDSGQFEVFLENYNQIYLDIRIETLTSDRNNSSGRLVILRDITEQKLAELEMKKVNKALQNQLIKVASLKEKLHKQAIRDPLTGIFNRRYLEEFLEKVLKRAKYSKTQVCLLMMDIDNFKEVNDSFGHKAGDEVLRKLGLLLTENTRAPGDIACRYGGEEFVIVLPEMDKSAALKRAEELRNQFMQLDYSFAQEKPTTISIGVAVFPDDGQTGEEVLDAADKALYAAKDLGKNQVL